MTQRLFGAKGGSVAILFTALVSGALAQQEPTGLARPNTSVVADTVKLSPPDAVELGGLLGDRYRASVRNRLLTIDEDELLSGYRHRPGKQAWIGEHVGKWLHAASLVYMHGHDAKLRTKLDRVVRELLKCQGPDGYLGTYTADQRFGLFVNADWDVWSHKYCILGLLAYYQATGDKSSLAAARKAGDLLLATFGPGRKSIIDAGTHQGMASTSVLEPIVLLYRATSDPKYLAFANQIVDAYDTPDGPHLLSDLLAGKPVRSISDAKAYEMLSNLVGLLELYRVQGDPKLLTAVWNAWNDVTAKRLYITGTASSHEVWTEDGVLPNDLSANVGETCVSVTWEQLNLELYRLTGDGRCIEQIERTVYNHLLAAQRPDGGAWCYYTPLNGRKYASSDTSCCLSSGPRGVALLPTFAYALSPEGIDVNLYGPSTAKLVTSAGAVQLAQTGNYPIAGTVSIKVVQAPAKPMMLRLRRPAWAVGSTVTLNGKPVLVRPTGGYLPLKRTWHSGDRLVMTFPVGPKVIAGSGNDDGFVAVQAGPVVMAIDQAHNPSLKWLRFTGLSRDAKLRAAKGADAIEGVRYTADGYWVEPRSKVRHETRLTLVPFYAAGRQTNPYSIWVMGPDPQLSLPNNPSLLAYGEESSSRVGNQTGSIADGDPTTRSVTYNGEQAQEDWYAVTLVEPVTISRVVYRHGAIYHDGGWFDTSAGKPRIQVRETTGGPWKDVATIDDYPASDAVTPPSLEPGQSFEVRFKAVKVIAVRVVGKPSHGDNADQAFSSCSELQAFGD